MSLFSFLRKNKQESASGESNFLSRAEEESAAVRGRGKRKTTKQGNQPVDPILPEKKRARRRLVGAVALVLAVVIGLPMVLDSEQKPLAEDIAIQIPSKDKSSTSTSASKQITQSPPIESATIDASTTLDPTEEVIDTPITAIVPAKVPPVVAAKSQPVVPVKPVGTVKAPAVDKPAVVVAEKVEPKVEPKVDHKPVVSKTPEIKVSEKPPEKTVDEVDESARARAILEGRFQAKPVAEKKPMKFTVQVAALASTEKVNELQDRLKNAGIRSYTQKVATASGERIRIRVGPFASKEEADKARAQLSALGLNGTVVPVNL